MADTYLNTRGLATLWADILAAIQSGGGSYTLPVASASTLGGVKVGNGLAIDANGVLSLNVTNGNLVSY